MQNQSIIKFPNNFKVVFSGINTRSVAIVLNIPYGVEKEPARQAGVSHVIERLIYMDLIKQTNRFGADLDTRVTYEFIEIKIATIRDNLNKLLTALSMAIFDFTPKVEALKNAKNFVISKIEKNKLAPNFILEKLTNENLYKKLGLSNNFYGTVASVDKLTLDDVKEYLAKIISPNNLVLSVVGDIENKNTDSDNERYADVYSMVMEKFYGKLINYRKHNAKFSECTNRSGNVYSEKTKNLFQDRFLIAYPCESYLSQNYKYVRLIDSYVKNYLREYVSGKDYIYGLNVELVMFANNGYIKIMFAVDDDRAYEVYYKILDLISDIREQGISVVEFEKLKMTYITKMIFNNEKAIDKAKSYAKKLVLRGEVFDVDSEIKGIRELDYNNFIIIMKKTLSRKNISVARVGKRRDDFLPFGDKNEL